MVQSGKDIHKFLMQESFKYLSNQGYKVFLEFKLPNNKVADVYGKKEDDIVLIECLLRPSLALLEMKKKNYKGYKTIIAYPSNFIPKVPIEEFFQTLKIDVPKELESPIKTSLTISDDLWKLINNNRINARESMEDVIWRWYNLLNEQEVNKDDKPN